jgi:hypothetical protein
MQDPAITASPAKKPSGRQMFRIAYQLLEVAGIPAPDTSADASEIIQRLAAQLEEMRGVTATSEEIPF